MKPKEWGGVTQIGEALIRRMDHSGQEIATAYASETLDDGSLGEVMAKRTLDGRNTYRSGGGANLGTPFLSTWADPSISFPDQSLPCGVRPFVIAGADGTQYTHFVGNSVFVGDGFMLGLAATSDTPYNLTTRTAATLAPLLVRLPSAAATVSGAAYLGLDAATRAKSSVLLDPITPTGIISEAYVLALGWKNSAERYAFAIVTLVLVPVDDGGTGRIALPTPKIYLGSTGSMALTELPLGMGLDWTFDYGTSSSYIYEGGLVGSRGRMTCTAPGQMEMIYLKTEHSYVVSTVTVHWADVPFSYVYSAVVFDVAAFDATTPPGFPGVWGPYLSPQFPGYDLHYDPILGRSVWTDSPDPDQFSGRDAQGTAAVYASQPTYNARRASMYVVRSTDFGQTWVMANEAAFEDGTYQPPPAKASVIPSLSVGISGSVVPTISPYSTVKLNNTATGRVYTLGYFPQTETTPYDPTTLKVTFNYPGGTIPFPSTDGLPYADRGITARCAWESFQLVGAGTTTFAVLTGRNGGYQSGVAAYLSDGDFFDVLTNNIDYSSGVAVNPLRPLHPVTVVGDPTYSATTSPHMYVRKGSGAFQRTPWPGDSFTYPDADTFPSAVPSDGVSGFTVSYSPTIPAVAVSWYGTGEGMAAFFLVSIVGSSQFDRVSPQDNPVTMIATRDGGASWTTLSIYSSMNMQWSCLIGPDAYDKGCCILYAALTSKPNYLQLMRISSDFKRVTKYGSPYPQQRGGLVNFKQYVHPGFPGTYDAPT